jgi:hypothetical protein
MCFPSSHSCVAVFTARCLSAWSSFDARAQIPARCAVGAGPRLSGHGRRAQRPGVGAGVDWGRGAKWCRCLRRSSSRGAACADVPGGSNVVDMRQPPARARGRQSGCAGLPAGGLRAVGGQRRGEDLDPRLGDQPCAGGPRVGAVRDARRSAADRPRRHAL